MTTTSLCPNKLANNTGTKGIISQLLFTFVSNQRLESLTEEEAPGKHLLVIGKYKCAKHSNNKKGEVSYTETSS